MGQNGGVAAKYNFFISVVLVISAVCWPYMQKGVHWYYQREAKNFFNVIEKEEIRYKSVNNKYLPFGISNNAEQQKKLKINLAGAKYFDFSVVEKDTQTFLIIAQLKPNLVKRWYFNGPKTKSQLIYEKTEHKRGGLVNHVF